jgi:hypothetical protein
MTITTTKPTGKQNITSRRETRHPHLCELSINYEGAIENIAVRPPDLSPHGMFVNTDQELENGAVLKLRFRLTATGRMIQARAEVRYCLKNVGVGVEFVDISAEDRQAIREAIAQIK